MKKVGILGGTFDPPHTGHLLVANEIREELQLNEIRFLPNNIPPHKAKASTTNAERLAMLNLALQGNEYFSIDTVEWEREGPSYTIETMKLLKKREPETEFYFIIGADMIEYLPKWKQIDELVELTHFVGVKRPQYQEVTDYPVTLVDIPEIYISSSQIRERVRKGKSIKYLVPEEVKIYIEENQLYGPK